MNGNRQLSSQLLTGYGKVSQSIREPTSLLVACCPLLLLLLLVLALVLLLLLLWYVRV